MQHGATGTSQKGPGSPTDPLTVWGPRERTVGPLAGRGLGPTEEAFSPKSAQPGNGSVTGASTLAGRSERAVTAPGSAEPT